MTKKKPQRNRRPKAIDRKAVALLVIQAESMLRGVLELYRKWRAKAPIEKRFDELLWSLEGFLPEVHFKTCTFQDEAGRFVERKVDDIFWWNLAMQRQKKEGDGHFGERRALQTEALKLYKKVVYWPIAKLRSHAVETGFDESEQIDSLNNKIKDQWTRLRNQFCDIGEQFRDEWWIRLHSGNSKDWIRDTFTEELKRQATWSTELKRRVRFADRHIGPIVNPVLQEYLITLRRLAELEPKVEPWLEFKILVPKDAIVPRREKSGKPRPKVREATRLLQEMLPKIPGIAIDKFLVAWCLKPFPK